MRLVYLALGWCAGIVIAASANGQSLAVWLALACLAPAGLVVARHDARPRLLLAVMLVFALGGLRFAFVPTTSDAAQYNGSGGLTLEGVVVAEPDARDDRVLLRLDAETVTRAGRTLPTDGLALVEAPPTANVHYGDRIRATGILTIPPQLDSFSYADHLARTGVFSLMPDAAVDVLSGGEGAAPFALLFDLKQQAEASIARSLPEPQASLLAGILLGDERGLAPEVRAAFDAVGASHVIAISGFNMVILGGAVERALRQLLPSRRRLSVVLALAVIAVYTLFVGASPSVVRAALMTSLLFIGGLLRRKTYVPASLAFVVIALSLVNPTVLWDIGFQLSAFATLGLMLFAEPLSRGIQNLLARVFPAGLRLFLSEPLAVTLAAQIAVTPLIALYFGRLPLASLPANLLVVPAQAALLFLGILATLATFVAPALAQAAYGLDMLLLSWTLGVVRGFARLTFASAELAAHPSPVALVYALALAGAALHATQPEWALRVGRLIRRRMVVSATVFAGIGTAVLVVAVAFSRPDGRLHVWFVDVGHSNAVLIQTPGGAHLLVDGGHFPSRLLTAIGDRLPFTDREIEALIVTQPDENDVGALAALVARYDVGVALTNGQPNLGAGYAELQDALAAREVVIARAGYTLDTGDGALLEVLHPQAQPELGDSLDDNALVLRLSYGKASFLLAGDLSAAGQAALLDAGQYPLARVMQMPQHGAARALDAAFLQAAQPQLAILQTDPANRRGDPDPDVMAMLGDTPLFRTDEGGTIHVWTDGESLWVEGER